MSKSSESLYWLDGDGIEQNDDFIKREILEYNKNGGTIYVGSDSMMNCTTCSFAAVIAFHSSIIKS